MTSFMFRLFGMTKPQFASAYPSIAVHHRDFPRKRTMERLSSKEAMGDLRRLLSRFPRKKVLQYFAYYLHVEESQVPMLIPSLIINQKESANA